MVIVKQLYDDFFDFYQFDSGLIKDMF